jgi:acetylornithine deacetylase/succinyl-diaminopimelate desuccinylase family protein
MREREMDEILGAIREERVTALLSDLVSLASPNPPGEERAVSAYVAEVLRDAGCRVSEVEVLPGRANVMAACGNLGRRFVLNTHTDVVPGGAWTEGEPFQPRVEGGFLYGRGAADAKGPLAAMMAAMEVLAAHGDVLGGEALLTAVVDEEGTSAGSKALARDLSADFGVVGEPTNLDVMTAHRGSVRCIVEVLGTSCHSASPSRGVNAIYEAVPVIESLRAMGARLEEREASRCGTPTLALTRMSAGVSNNMVPDGCEILVDRRLVPGESEESALQEIDDALDGLRRSHPSLRVRIARTIETTGGPASTDEDEPIVQLASRAVRHVTGRTPSVGGLGVACDMVHLVGAGIPTVILGPGDIALAHTPKERVPLREVYHAAQIYAWMVVTALSSKPGSGAASRDRARSSRAK